MPSNDDDKIILTASLIYRGEVIGSSAIAMGKTQFDYKHERGNNTEHNFSKPVQKAILQAIERYDKRPTE